MQIYTLTVIVTIFYVKKTTTYPSVEDAFLPLLSNNNTTTTRYGCRGHLPVVVLITYKAVSPFTSYLSVELDARAPSVCLHALMKVSDMPKSFRNAKLQTGVLAAIMLPLDSFAGGTLAITKALRSFSHANVANIACSCRRKAGLYI